MKKAVVTGANGFLGTALCKALAEDNIEVIAVVKDEQENIMGINALPGVRVVFCSLENIERLPFLVEERDIDMFYHLAWRGTAGPERGDYSVQQENVKAACKAVEACKMLSCHRFIFAGSIMEYEVAHLMDSAGSLPLNTIYSTAKLSADYMARAMANDMEVQYIRTIITNIYGPGEKSARMLNTTLRKLLQKEHCSFTSGEQYYDFVYIDDAAKMFVELGKKGLPNKTYLIGSSHPRPLKEFLLDLRDVVDSTAELGIGEIKMKGISLDYYKFDLEAVKEDTGFEPMTSFKDGIRNTLDWMVKEENGI